MLEYLLSHNLEEKVVEVALAKIVGMAKQVPLQFDIIDSEERTKLNELSNLEKYIYNLVTLEISLKKESEQIKLSNEKQDNAINEYIDKLASLQLELERLQNSRSYKYGLLITLIPRKLRGLLQCYKENGGKYTLNRILYHLKMTQPNFRLINKLKASNVISPLQERRFKQIVFSIIIPVYNAEFYLEDCLNSILNQTLHPSGYEIICIDDGSTDNSLKILKKYKKQYSNITILSQQNQYAGIARNQGMKDAKGEYLYFVDADDFMEKDILEEVYLKIEKFNPDIIIVRADIYNEEKNSFQKAPYLLNTQYLPKKDMFSKNDIPDHIFNIGLGTVWDKFFKKNLVYKTQLNFPNFRNINDLPFVYPMLAVAKSITVIDKTLYHLRRGQKTNLSSNRDANKLNCFEAYRLFQTRLQELDVYNQTKKSFVNAVFAASIFELSNFKDTNLQKKAEQKFMEEYRYIFGTKGKNPLICIGINPSTAKPMDLDNTLKSVQRIAKNNGFDSFIMFNVYAQRATNPDDMDKEMNSHLHEENMKAFEYILSLYEKEKPSIWAAWGTIIEKRPYLKQCLLDMVELGQKYEANWYTSGKISKKGHPHHPLYLKSDSNIDKFDVKAYVFEVLT